LCFALQEKAEKKARKQAKEKAKKKAEAEMVAKAAKVPKEEKSLFFPVLIPHIDSLCLLFTEFQHDSTPSFFSMRVSC
jgi:hypothetical protein